MNPRAISLRAFYEHLTTSYIGSKILSVHIHKVPLVREGSSRTNNKYFLNSQASRTLVYIYVVG